MIMPTNKVHVRVNETYDLSTKENSLGLIAIHTPSVVSLKTKFEGLFRQFKYIRFNSVSVRCACASLMPLDPLQVGLEAGMVAPQDMFNPILYTAVSNESMGNLLDKIYALNNRFSDAESTTSGPSLDWVDDSLPEGVDRFSVYYSLLSSERFATAMPQQGFEMNGVVPLAHEIVTNVAPTGSAGVVGGSSSDLIGPIMGKYYGHGLGNGDLVSVPIQSYSAGVRHLPRVPTMIPVSGNSYGYNEPTPVYCIAAIMPPAKLQRLFFRMVVSWSITFEEFRPLDNILTFTGQAAIGNEFYKSDYDTQSASMTALANAVDGSGMDVSLVATSVS